MATINYLDKNPHDKDREPALHFAFEQIKNRSLLVAAFIGDIDNYTKKKEAAQAESDYNIKIYEVLKASAEKLKR